MESMYVEYGTTHSTDNCFHCWLEGFGEVEATHEVVTGYPEERTPLCARHAEEVLASSITVQ